MQFHVPRPPKGWPKFAAEVGIIVLGVLIALGAQQVVESLHWREEVREADKRIRDDIVSNLTNASERFAIDPCLRNRLAELRDSLMLDRVYWPGSRASFANDVYKSGFPSVYRTPNRPWMQGSWNTALNGEVLNHFKPERVRQLALVFDDAALLEQTQSDEVATSSDLGDLAFAGEMSAEERRSNLKLVARLDAIDARMLFLSQVLLDNAREAGVAPNPQQLRQTLDEQRSYRGSCVRNNAAKAS
jgi:hypothetical protein